MSDDTLDGGQLAGLLGPEDNGWYGTYVLDWIGLCADLTDSDVRGYLILRSLIFDAKGRRRNPVRIFTLAELCKLIPGPKGKPSSLTRIRDLLRRLSFVGLVSTPDGKPLKTSSRGAAQGKQIRMRINDRPINGYVPQWRNTEDKLDEIRPEAERAAAEAAERDIARQAAKRAEDAANETGRNSDPDATGRNSDPAGRNSDPAGRNSDPGSGADQGKRGLVFSAYSSSLLSGEGEAADQTATAAGAGAGTDERDDRAARNNDQARQVPGQRAAEPIDVDAMRTALPGLGYADAVELVPLVADAVADGWTTDGLYEYLAARCDTRRVSFPPAVYRKHLKALPAPQAAAPAAPKVSRAELVAACTVCDEYGQITTESGVTNCRHTEAAEALAAA